MEAQVPGGLTKGVAITDPLATCPSHNIGPIYFPSRCQKYICHRDYHVYNKVPDPLLSGVQCMFLDYRMRLPFTMAEKYAHRLDQKHDFY